jgi:putative ABC transport system permease protein
MKYGNLIFKNVMRNKRRSFLTISSLSVSLFLTVTLATILTELSRGSEVSNPLRLITRHAVSLMFEFPVAHRERIENVAGVKHALPYTWFGGYYKDESIFFSNFAVDEKLLRAHMTEVKMSDEEWSKFVSDRQGAIVGQKLVELFDFKVGQRITLQSPIYRINPELVINGVFTGGDEKTLFFHYDYFNEMLPEAQRNKVSTIGIMANSVDDVPKIAQAVDTLFINSEAPTKTESEREFAISFEAMMGSVKQFMFGIIGAIVFSLLLVMTNTMAMSVRERKKEVGTLKAIGFQPSTIIRLFVLEAILLSVIGAVIGIGGALLLYSSFDMSLYIPYFFSFIPTTETVVVAFVGALFLGMASVMYSAYRVSNMTIADALRSVE